MDFLNTLYAQFADLFRTMSVGSRVTAGLLAALVAVSLGYLFNYHGTSADTLLFNGEPVPGSMVPVIEAAFGKAGLNNFKFEGTRIRVPSGLQDKYLAALAANNALPPDFDRIMDDAIKSGGIWVDKVTREETFRAAKEKKLGMIIRAMSGIEAAMVAIDSEKAAGFSGAVTKTASVNVRSIGGLALTDVQAMAIRMTVCKAVAGLAPQNVNVTDLANPGLLLPSSPDGTGGVVGDPFIERKKKYEQEWREKIRNGLAAYVPGVSVQVDVELSRERNRHRVTTQHDKGVPIQTDEMTHTSTTEGTSPGGRPGYAANQPNSSMAVGGGLSAKTNKSDQDESHTTTVNAPNTTQEEVDTVGLTPQRVKVAINVPNSHFEGLWREMNPGTTKTPDPAALEKLRLADLQKIRDYAASLLPLPEGMKETRDLVTVNWFQDRAPAPILPIPFSTTALDWLSEHWNTVGMIGLALFGLMMLRSTIRSIPVPRPVMEPTASPAATAAAEPADEPEEVAAGAAGSSRLKRFTSSGPTLRDELTDLVQEDPDAAANVLRAWIGNPSGKTS